MWPKRSPLGSRPVLSTTWLRSNPAANDGLNVDAAASAGKAQAAPANAFQRAEPAVFSVDHEPVWAAPFTATANKIPIRPVRTAASYALAVDEAEPSAGCAGLRTLSTLAFLTFLSVTAYARTSRIDLT